MLQRMFIGEPPDCMIVFLTFLSRWLGRRSLYRLLAYLLALTPISYYDTLHVPFRFNK
jgi:hypothetical protein